MKELKKYQSVVLAKAITVKDGFRYWMDQETGDVIATDLNSPEYQKDALTRQAEKKARAAKKLQDKVNRKAQAKANLLSKIAALEKKVQSL